jgi:radical SAM protein with 4Fe4S-binding SPASM domain
LTEKGLPVLLKSNGLKQNKAEILKIKKFAEELLGKNKFGFGYYIFPGLDGSKGPCQHRLNPQEIMEIEASDPDMSAQIKEEFHRPINFLRGDYLYPCTAGYSQFVINPFGYLKVCTLMAESGIDCTKDFKEGFFKKIPELLQKKFSTGSACRDCKLRVVCLVCPARAYLETKDEEAPVGYFCELARARSKQISFFKKQSN